jgi:hypothetical protein
MNVEFGTEAMQFREKEHINGIFVAVYSIPCEIGHFSDKWDRLQKGLDR